MDTHLASLAHDKSLLLQYAPVLKSEYDTQRQPILRFLRRQLFDFIVAGALQEMEYIFIYITVS